MTLTLIPDPEKVVADYLREIPDILAITEDRRVGSTTPKSGTDKPWVRYTVIDDSAVGGHRSDHLTGAYLQFECYAGKDGGQPEASLLARTLRAALTALGRGEGSVSGATVSGVEIRGFSRQPDTQLNDRQRFIVSAMVWLHA